MYLLAINITKCSIKYLNSKHILYYFKCIIYNVQLVTTAHNSDIILSFRLCCLSHFFFLLTMDRFLFLEESL